MTRDAPCSSVKFVFGSHCLDYIIEVYESLTSRFSVPASENLHGRPSRTTRRRNAKVSKEIADVSWSCLKRQASQSQP
eukprot:CAMPEP_0169170666 /NCGR_PEP_ID=MMETSP1015-20121227/62286_1 /TAXON_ID=342587 /ORGANISM="Karlodinium micrum, Strain CCMP2283" /LENGTH=77 /DNA_ID=CAMNT_0009243777 /DNA_START=134 /DNA_END=364 /DNA_ORIENTATION=-